MSSRHFAIRSLCCLALLLAVWFGATRAADAQTRIMPLGDSITGSPGCWRALLWNRLQTAGFTSIDFVGTLPPQGCGVAHDGDNEGHGGILATNMANQNQLVPWLAATRPDVVMMHLGTNDVWSALAPAVILTAFSKLVDQMRAQNPTMKILVAQIIPMNPSNCPACAQRVVAFNAAIPAWAAGKSTAQSPITVVDQFTGFNDATDTGDGVHPNAAGNQKISDRWFPALSAVLSGTTAPSFAVTANPASLQITVGATATTTVNVIRSGGFSAAVTLSATGLPAGVSASFGPQSATGASTLTLSAASTAAPGAFSATISGAGGGLTRTAPLALTVVSTTGGSGPATATPVVAASGQWFNEEQVRLTSPVALTALSLAITLQTTGGIAFSGQYNTSGALTQSHTSTASTIVYQFSLPAGQSLSAGTFTFAAQASGTGTVHPTAGDSYTLTYTAGGTQFSANGHF
jgi:lysophospholipase L1-like esterase